MNKTKIKIYNLSQKVREHVKNLFFPITGIVTVLLFAASPIFYGAASATIGQITSRSVQMSNDTISQTGTSYLVSYIPTQTDTTIDGIVVDFCSVDPIPGDTCTKPTGFSVGTPTVSSPASISGGTWAWASYNSGEGVIGTNSGTGTYAGTNAVISFTISTVTNPSTNNTAFYARMFDYATAAGASGYTSGNPSAGAAPLDQGGDAITTTNQIVITSKVQEYLSFCVDNGTSCTADSISLGNVSDVLSASSSYTDITAHYVVQTNASHNASITIQGTPLTTGTQKIDNTPGTSGTCSTNTTCISSVGSAQFGLCSWEQSGSTITIATTYLNANCSSVTTGANDAGSAQFGWNDSGTSGIPSTYGDTLATVSAGASSTGEIAFLANISDATLPGTYATTLNLVATGSF